MPCVPFCMGRTTMASRYATRSWMMDNGSRAPLDPSGPTADWLDAPNRRPHGVRPMDMGNQRPPHFPVNGIASAIRRLCIQGRGPRAMKKNQIVRNYIILPCCLLLLNLCTGLVGYKAKMIEDPYVQTGAVIAMVLFGSSLVAFVLAPSIETLVGTLRRGSRKGMGEFGDVLFILALGAVVFWLYYVMYIRGPEFLLPASWRNPRRF
jgi:hypothetical protein